METFVQPYDAQLDVDSMSNRPPIENPLISSPASKDISYEMSMRHQFDISSTYNWCWVNVHLTYTRCQLNIHSTLTWPSLNTHLTDSSLPLSFLSFLSFLFCLSFHSFLTCSFHSPLFPSPFSHPFFLSTCSTFSSLLAFYPPALLPSLPSTRSILSSPPSTLPPCLLSTLPPLYPPSFQIPCFPASHPGSDKGGREG